MGKGGGYWIQVVVQMENGEARQKWAAKRGARVMAKKTKEGRVVSVKEWRRESEDEEEMTADSQRLDLGYHQHGFREAAGTRLT